jgi:N-acylneuraminate cytidylyltransferase
LLAWSIAAATAAPSVEGTWVSTDDEEIATVAAAHGARVVRRPAALAGDHTPTIDVIRHALAAIRGEGHAADAVMTLQPTNPLRPVTMVEAAVASFRSRPCDSLVSVSQRPLKTGEVLNGYYLPSYAFGQQSRLTAPVTYENGLIYITQAACIEAGSLCGGRSLAFITPRPFDEVDIDDATDLVSGAAIATAVASQLGY